MHRIKNIKKNIKKNIEKKFLFHIYITVTTKTGKLYEVS
jgi:hypothetical protein